MLVQSLFQIFQAGLNKIGVDSADGLFFEVPKNTDYGDFSTNIAMLLAKQLKKAPRTIAQDLIDNLSYDKQAIENVSIDGPGFINIKFAAQAYTKALASIAYENEDFGKLNIGKGKTVNVEYVSVNPTGLLHLGHGRNAAIGDTIANLYKWLGYKVTREYYFNNAGNQMNLLAQSIYARYMQLFKGEDFPFPEDGYHGDYIKAIASEIKSKFDNKYIEGTYQDITDIRKFGENWCFEKITLTLKRMNIKQDVFYNEDTLYKTGKIKELINTLKNQELSYEKDGATWLALTKLGLNDDRVIIKSSGEPTYRLPDIAYHIEKFKNQYDLLIDVFGSDHIATIPDVLATVSALGYDSNKVKVLIHQFVTLTENGEQVKMSKRTGKNYTLDDLLDEVGADVVRFFLIMRNISTHLEFDLSLAREQSDKNPVFYLQYAHARISSILQNAIERNIDFTSIVQPKLELLTHQKEIELIKNLIKFPQAIQTSAEKFEPQILADYLRTLATTFHAFYHDCRILGSEKELEFARLKLANLTKIALKNGLTILGISAPERM